MTDFRSMQQIAWTGYVTIVRTEVRRFMRIKAQTLIPPVITMVLYLYIFGSIIGRKVGSIMDMPYIQFIGPGIIVMALINNAYTNVSSSFFSSKNHRFYEEMFVTPVPSVSIVLGYLSGGVLRGLLVMCLVSIVVYLFNPFDIHNILCYSSPQSPPRSFFPRWVWSTRYLPVTTRRRTGLTTLLLRP